MLQYRSDDALHYFQISEIKRNLSWFSGASA